MDMVEAILRYPIGQRIKAFGRTGTVVNTLVKLPGSNSIFIRWTPDGMTKETVCYLVLTDSHLTVI